MIDPSKKTIVFDFGNVIVDLDYPLVFENFRKVVNYDFSGGMPKPVEEVFHKYERGHVSSEAFIWAFQQYKAEADPRDIIDAWNSVITRPRRDRLDMVQELRKEYNVALLSNINQLHELYVDKMMKEDLDEDDFRNKYFDKVYYSHLIGMRKPDAEIYEFVREDLGVPSSDILFIDDTAVNIEAAYRHGWRGAVHDPKDEIIEMISGYIEEAFYQE